MRKQRERMPESSARLPRWAWGLLAGIGVLLVLFFALAIVDVVSSKAKPQVKRTPTINIAAELTAKGWQFGEWEKDGPTVGCMLKVLSDGKRFSNMDVRVHIYAPDGVKLGECSPRCPSLLPGESAWLSITPDFGVQADHRYEIKPW